MLPKIFMHSSTRRPPEVVSVRCPHCGNLSNFEGAGADDLCGQNNVGGVLMHYRIGVRRCPHAGCQGQLFYQELGQSISVYPVQRVDFDTTDIPTPVVAAFDEALSCEAHNLLTASAIMVRKTLELVCADRQATGNNLKEKITALKTQVTLPQQLFDAMDNLRLLGNDAAHIDSNVFQDIGKEEVDLAIDLTKEILKALYQLDSIVRRLEGLKKPDASS